MAICPKCSAAILSVNVREIPIRAIRTEWVGVSYSCPSCDVLLSVGIDPIALKSDTVDEILDRLRKH